MAEVSDFVVVLHQQFAAQDGKWRSEPFATGGRNTLTENGVELKNAYVTLNVFVPQGSPDANIRIIVNDNPLPRLVQVRSDSQRTAFVTFPAQFLNDGGGNRIELHSQQERAFGVDDVTVHWRQNS